MVRESATAAARADPPARRMIRVPVGTVRVGDLIRAHGRLREVTRRAPMHAHMWAGPYSPVVNYRFELAAHVDVPAETSTKLIVAAGEWLEVWRVSA